MLFTVGSVRAEFAEFERPQGTSFDLILESYQTAPQPASLADFSLPAPQVLTCEIVIAEKPNDLVEGTSIYIGQHILREAIPATPAHGPLFPAKPAVPAVTEPVVYIGAHAPDQEMINLFHNSLTATDFVISLDKNDKGVYFDIGSPVRILFRKKENYLPFVLFKSDETKPFLVGYCYE